jgi:hypothetical protein
MGKIISGGLKSQHQQSSPEGWGGYAVRNVARAPVELAKNLASGFGVGDLAHGAVNQLPGPEFLRNMIHKQIPLVTQKQAARPFEQGLPEYLTKEQPGDEYAQALLGQLPFIAAGGGFSSPLAFGRELATSLGVLGGSEVGKYAGGELGERLGNRPAGEVSGSLAGGLAAPFAVGSFFNRPSQSLAPKLQATEEAAFNAAKAGRVAAAESQFVPKLQEARKALQASEFAIPKQKSLFESLKKSQIGEVKNEIASYKNQIKSLDEIRAPLYDTATKLEKNSRGSARDIAEAIKEVSQDIKKGVMPSDQKALSHNISAVKNAIAEGTLSLKDAKKFQKNFNDQIYNRDATNSFKRYMNRITSELNNFIGRNGSPEHNANWNKAEQATRELKTLKKGEKEFLRSKDKAIRDIQREKFSLQTEAGLKQDIREAKGALKATEQERDAVINAIGNEKYTAFLESKDAQKNVEKAIGTLISTGIHKTGAVAVGSVLGAMVLGKPGAILGGAAGKLVQIGRNEYKIAKEVFQKHPELLKETGDLILKLGKKDAPRAIPLVNTLGKKIAEIGRKDESKPTSKRGKGRIISGGLISRSRPV